MQGWRIVGFSALVIGAIATVIWLIHGVDEQGLRMVLRATARTSCLLFLSAFIASALQRIWSNPFSTWLLKNRRYLGLSFAVSHTYHAFAWTGLWFITAGTNFKFDPLGVLGYVLLYAMTITFFRQPAVLIGRRAWQVLHTAGMYYFWLAFTVEFSLRMPKSIVIYLPFVVLLIVGLILRLIAPKMQKKLIRN